MYHCYFLQTVKVQCFLDPGDFQYMIKISSVKEQKSYKIENMNMSHFVIVWATPLIQWMGKVCVFKMCVQFFHFVLLLEYEGWILAF